MSRLIPLCLTISLAFLAGTAEGIVFTLPLAPEQAVPPPGLGGSTPTGSAMVDVNTITGETSITGSYSGMTSNVVAAHLHGLAAPGVAAGVVFGLNPTGGTSGTLSGSTTLAPSVLAGLLAGETYVNVHTLNNGPGEIRGQVVDDDIMVFTFDLSPLQSVPSPTLNGSTPSGNATLVVDTSSGETEISGTYEGLTGNVAAAHLHGLGAPGQVAGVIFGLDQSGGTSGELSGMSTLSAENLAGLLAGNTYINVHTAINPPGEIRGQVVPEPGTLTLLIVGAVGVLVLFRRCKQR